MIQRKFPFLLPALCLAAVSWAASAETLPPVPAADTGAVVAAPPAADTDAVATAPAAATTAEKMDPKARLAALVAAARAAGKPAYAESFDRYKVILYNNIFVRDRRYVEEQDTGPRVVVQTGPEQATMLRGIVRQMELPGAPYFAYLEDTRTGATMKVAMGEPICQGKLANPSLDSVDYVRGSTTIHVAVGQNLAGKVAETPAPAEETPATSSASASTASKLPASPESVADKMRLKRLKDLAK